MANQNYTATFKQNFTSFSYVLADYKYKPMETQMFKVYQPIIRYLNIILVLTYLPCCDSKSQTEQDPDEQITILDNGSSETLTNDMLATNNEVTDQSSSEINDPQDSSMNQTDPSLDLGDSLELDQRTENESEDQFINETSQQFIDLSDQIIGNPIHRRYGIAISDIDQDGDFEIIVTGYGASNEAYDYQDGQWIDIMPNQLKDEGRQAIGVAACDINGDGSEEIYFLNVDRFGGLGEVSDRLYQRQDNGEWIDLFEQTVNVQVLNRFSGRSVACLDRNGDQRYGVFVANYGGPMKLFELQDQNRLVDVGPEVGINLITGGRALLSLPRPEPGMHIFAGNEGGANFLFINRNGLFEEIAQESGIADARETVRGAATLDMNEDGLFDLVYGNWEGPHRLMIAQASEDESARITYEDQATPELQEPSRIRTVIAADFDNDGYEELFFNNIGEPNRLFRRSEDAWVQVPLDVALEPQGLGTGAAVVDSNEDGILELWIAHGESGAQPLSLYQWSDQGFHWLRVAPLTNSGAPARGAKVSLFHSSGRIQRRVIDAGSGYLCQMEPVAHFGLGRDTDLEKVLIEWVDGSQKEIRNITVDQLLTTRPN